MSYNRHTPSVPYGERTPLMKLAGIGNETAAKRELRRRFRQPPTETPVTRPGARFYVTAISGRKVAYLMGPFASHMSALSAVPQARRLMRSRGHFASVGTASRPDTVQAIFGRGGA